MESVLSALVTLVAATIVVGVVVLVGITCLHLVREPTAEGSDSAPMSRRARQALITYLLVFGVVLVYVLVSVATVELPDAVLLPEVPPIPSNAAAGSLASPAVAHVFPQVGAGQSSGGRTVALMVFGQEFTEGKSIVRVNAASRPTEFVGKTMLRATLEPSDLANTGWISIDVTTNGQISNAIPVRISRPVGEVVLLRWPPGVVRLIPEGRGGDARKVETKQWVLQFMISRETQLLVLALCAGALGSYVHAVKSLADFIGNQTAVASWFWWYITRPFLGMALAGIVYAALRSGILPGSAGIQAVNPFAVMAVSALVGMFADKAAQKLGEVFDTLFKADDHRSGKMIAPVIEKLDPPVVKPRTTPLPVLTIIGDRFSKVNMVRLNTEEHKPDTSEDKKLTVTLRANEIDTPRVIKVTAVNADGSASPAATLYVTDLAITDPGALTAPRNAPYEQMLVATGGTAPHKWSVRNGPAWLKVDPTSGKLSGVPAAAGPVKFDAVVTDATGASVPLAVNLTVT